MLWILGAVSSVAVLLVAWKMALGRKVRARMVHGSARSLQTITLDCVPAEQMNPSPLAEPRVAPPLRVLLVEDNVVNRILASRLLEKRQHQVTAVVDGRAAVAAIRENSYDIVLMDIQMPGMNGFEATATIRVHEAITGRHVAILAMTAHAMEEDRERCLNAGMDGYVSKPIEVGALFAAIDAAVAAARLIESAPLELRLA